MMVPMAVGAVEHDQVERSACWCCGNTFEDQDLTRLGNHPEVGVCAGCARWLNRRARASADRGEHSAGAWMRRGIQAARSAVVRAGAPDWPVVGPLLRRLDRHLP